MMLKYSLLTAEQIVEPYYFVTPQTVKLWDWTWDFITNKKFVNKEYGYEKTHNPSETINQEIDCVFGTTTDTINNKSGKHFNLKTFKFACGWFTLYSKQILNLIGIPDWLGHYGPEDTNMMFMSEFYKMEQWPISQYVLNGLYISENYVSRDTKYNSKIKLNNLKDKFRQEAEAFFTQEVNKAKDLIKPFS
jgi:hypothetical protein